MRVAGVFSHGDCPIDMDPIKRADTHALLARLYPGVENPIIDRDHTGIAIAAISPRLALNLAELSRFMALELAWSKRTALRELAIQTLNFRLRCYFGFESRLEAARLAGIEPELIAAIPYWQSTSLFSDEQRLVVEYTLCVVGSTVTDYLLSRVIAHFGEQQTVEFTAVVGFWSCWATMLNAAQP